MMIIRSVIVAVLVLFCACSSSFKSQTSSNTNWLADCSTDSECRGAARCQCGFCTIDCNTDSECSPIGMNASCVSASELAQKSNPCVFASSTSAICMVQCQDDSECKEHAEQLLCQDGRCIAEATEQASSEGNPAANRPAVCQDVESDDDFGTVLFDETEALALRHGDCSTDADCIDVGIEFSCSNGSYGYYVSGCPQIIAEDQQEQFLQELDQLGDQLCQCLDDFQGGAWDCFDTRIPVCVGGKCQRNNRADSSVEDAVISRPAICQDIDPESAEDFDTVYSVESVEIAHRHADCRLNADCIEVQIDFTCPNGFRDSPCTRAIAEDQQEQFFQELNQFQDQLCQCIDVGGFATGDCLSRVPVCLEEKCQLISSMDPDFFALYLLEDPLSAIEVENRELNELGLQAEPLLTINDIVSYTWNTHTVRLTDIGMSKMPTIGTLDLPFVIVALGQRQYLGAFWGSQSSRSWDHPVIMVDAYTGNSEFQIECGYASAMDCTDSSGNDVRSSDAIRQALEAEYRLE